MVNTRRMESSGSVPFSGHRYCTRKTLESTADLGFSSVSSTDGEESQEGEEDWLTGSQDKRKKHRHPKSEKKRPSRVRELRNRFVCNELTHHVRKREVRSCRKRVTLNERHSLSMYKMRDVDSYDHNDSDEECYSQRARRHLRHLKSHMGRVERRTALSLRPLTAKSYVDPSPMTCNSDDSDAVGVRRNTRQRNFQCKSLSWITDDQMPKKGYPKVNFSEDDSRDDQHLHNTPSPHRTLEGAKRGTRHDINGMPTKREIKKNTKYLHDYETTEINTDRRLRKTDKPRNLKNHSFDKENKSEENTRMNGQLRKRKKVVKQIEGDEEEEGEDIDDDDEEEEEEEEEEVAEEEEDEEDDEAEPDEVKGKEDENNKNANVEQKTQTNKKTKEDISRKDSSDNQKEETKENSSESETIIKRNTRSRRARLLREKFSPRRTRTTNRKLSDSSSSEEEKGYSLRDRAPKPSAIAMRNNTDRRARDKTLRSRHHFNIRRKVSSSSSRSDSSDSDNRHRKSRGKNTKNQHEQPLKSGAGSTKLIPIGPETLDKKVRFNTVGGLDSHVQCLKEMILLPMVYPEVYQQFQMQPPRGVLFYGPPGTGKTLIARALANECSFSSRKVSFFMRKGADLLSKWIGESEKQLRVLFEQAAEMKPSIIFFDELDGLAPVRSSRQDQIHASIVSTLLALMDGLDDRGEIIIIGATNRVDAIDPALRRPGRFDRELFFPLPARKERQEILNIHVSQWTSPPNKQLLNYLAENTVGYSGSDLRALCSEAVIHSFRRTYPQVYNSEHRLLLDPENVKVEKIDFLRAKSLLVASAHHVGQGLGKKMLPILKPIFVEPLKSIMGILKETFPHGVNSNLAKVKLSAGVRPAQLLILGNGSDHGQTTHLAPAILHSMEHIHAHVLDLTTLYKENGRAPEEMCIQTFHEVRRNVPSILYIPSIDRLWNFVSDTVKEIFKTQLLHLDPYSPILLLATAETLHSNLSEEIKDIFSCYRREIYQLNVPNTESRKSFFKPLLIDKCLKPPRPPRTRPKTPPPLPKAPTPPPTPMTELEKRKLFEQEERTLRELRIFLRDMCKKLANNRLFFMFTKPVDTEEVPDYPNIIKQPMDLETMMTKVDLHRYECAKDFLNDIELICQNALEYNPAKTSTDKQIRHRACSLRDYAYTLIKNEMDSDFEDKCQGIVKKRLERKASVIQYLPAFLQTAVDAESHITPEDNPTVPDTNGDASPAKEDAAIPGKEDTPPVKENALQISSNGTSRINTYRKRKIPSWQRGFVSTNKKKKRKLLAEDLNEERSSGEEDAANKQEDIKMEETTTSEESKESIGNFQLNSTNPIETPLTVNCDNLQKEQTGPSQSPNAKRRLSDLLSPSELLEDTLDFDDVDQALNENVVSESSLKLMVDVNKEELYKILEYSVKVTYNQPLQSLLKLHFQLSRIINQYSRTSNRKNLPTELRNELARYKTKIDHPPTP